VTNYPSLGAVVSHELTPKELALPGFVSIGRPANGPGFLGMNYAPFTVQNPGQPPTNIRPPALVDELRVHRRQQLFYAVEEGFEKRGEAAKAHQDIYGKAFSLVADKSGKKVFDLSSEKSSLLRDYGERGTFGKGC